MAWHWKDRSSAGMLRDLETVIAEFEPDIVSFHNLPGVSVTAWSAPKKFGAKCVQVAHDLNLICPNSSMFKHGTSCSKQCTSCWIWRSGFKEKSKTIDAFVGISQFIADRIIDQGMFSKSNMRVINNSQSIADTQPPNVIGLPRFGFLGSLIPAKGIGWILDRWPPEIALEIAGRGSEAYLAELKSKASGKNVRFVGYVDSSNFIQSVDAIVIPSLWNEALGGVAIEAAANRRPVIAANRGGLPEIVKDGVNGLLYDPDVAGDFEQALRKMTANSNLFSALADNSRQSVGHFLDMERFLSQYEMLYYELLQ
jgi:glycosyltransferase involved in cell wall biosynthesis